MSERETPFWRRPIWLLGHVIALTAVVLFVRLGFWQLDRLDEKRARNDVIAARTDGPPVDVVDVDPGVAEYQHVTAAGTFDGAGEVVVRYQSLQGSVGRHVVTPLVLSDGRAVLVNRGWIPDHLDVPPPPAGEVAVEGTLLESRTSGPRNPDDGVLTVLNRLDVARVQQQSDRELVPLWLSQTAPSPDDDFPIRLPPPARDEGPHLSYAGQWFLFAGVVGVGYPLLLRRRRHTVDDV